MMNAPIPNASFVQVLILDTVSGDLWSWSGAASDNHQSGVQFYSISWARNSRRKARRCCFTRVLVRADAEKDGGHDRIITAWSR